MLAHMPSYAELEASLRDILRNFFEARLVLCEMRRATANFELGSPFITPEKRAELTKMRDAALVEWGEVMTELEAVKEACEKESLPR